MKFLRCTFLLIFPFMLSAQEEDLPSHIENIVEQIAESREDEDFSFLYENFVSLSQNKLNLNTVTKEQLSELYFLSEEQIENFMYYQYTYKPFLSVYELSVIDGFDEQTIKTLLLFAEINNSAQIDTFSVGDYLKNGVHEIYSKTNYTVERRAGYKNVDEETLQKNPNKSYLGGPIAQTVRYSFDAKNKLIFGITMEKDAGEPFWNSHQKGFDYYAPYLQLNNLWKLDKIVVGNFSASFGYGLVLNTNFSMGKSSYVLNVLPKSSGLSRSASSNEYRFFRGVGATFAIKRNLHFSAFYSNKKLDATPIVGTDNFSSIKTDGYHRTELEMGKKNVLRQQVGGANFNFQKGVFQGGITAVGVLLADSLVPTSNYYNQYYFSGKRQFNVSANYAVNMPKWKFFGETAFSFSHNAMATLNGMFFSPISRVRFIAIQRYYSEKYQAWYGNSFGENSSPCNESGFYVGAEVLPFGHFRFSAYYDAFRFPWFKSGVAMSSEGNDALVQVDFTPKDNLSMYLRYKYKENEKNTTESGITYLSPYGKHSCKYVLKYGIGENVKFQNTVEWNRTESEKGAMSSGFAIEQNIGAVVPHSPFSVNVHYVFFDAPNYANRIYFYEKDVLYVFSVPSLYGKGNRICLNLSAKLKSGFSCAFKMAYTKYIDRETIGSSLEQIDGNHRTDLTLLLRWRIR